MIDRKIFAGRIDQFNTLEELKIIYSIESLENEEMWSSRVIDEYSIKIRSKEINLESIDR